MGDIETAIGIAARWHRRLRDKQGLPSILHVLRVVLALPVGEAQVVGALHDTVEDTGLTLTFLRAWDFPDHIIDAVDAITRREDETYTQYIHRLAGNDLAKTVKIVDLRDNLARGAAFPSLCERYRRALDVLGGTEAKP